MRVFTDELLDFDKEDVDRLDQALKKFWDTRGQRGYPDFSPGAELYAPILAFSALRSQKRIERLTWAILFLTGVLAALTAVLTFLTLKLMAG